MAARKAASRKTGAKKTAKKAPKKAAKKAAAGKPKPKQASAKEAPTKKKTAASRAASKSQPGVSSAQVSMGHVFSLRPRVATSFRPDDFRRARQLLAEESYPDVLKAARAVVEKALELTHEGPQRSNKSKRY